MQVIYGFLQIISATIIIVILFQILRHKFLDTQNEKISLQLVFKKIMLITIQASLFWVLWFMLGNLFSFMQWAIYYESLDFNHWRWHSLEEDPSFLLGFLIVILCFPLSFFIIKKLNIKL